MKRFTLFIVSAFCLTSCTVNRLTVGAGPEGSDYYDKKTYTYAKHVYVIFGIFSLRDPKLRTPTHGNYQFEATTDADDWVISLITGGLVSTRTERIFIRRTDYRDPFKNDLRKIFREKLNNNP